VAALGLVGAVLMGRLHARQAAAGAVLLTAVIGSRVMTLLESGTPLISCLPDQPLYTQLGSGLDPSVRSHLLAESLARPEAAGQHLESRAFKHSRGFVLKFNREGAAHLHDGPWAFLRPFFERVCGAHHPTCAAARHRPRPICRIAAPTQRHVASVHRA
jgi:hypothetical protein